MYTNTQLSKSASGRRSYSPEFKAQVVATCRIPGMSVASVARQHGINHNILHRWLRELAPVSLNECVSSPPAFIELPMPQIKAESTPAASDNVQVELRRGDLTIKVSWPVASVSECSRFLAELLR
jgi:transposase